MLPICDGIVTRKGYPKRTLAYEAVVNRTYMSKLEKGGSYVGLEIIGKLADVLEIEPAELLKLPPKKKPVAANPS